MIFQESFTGEAGKFQNDDTWVPLQAILKTHNLENWQLSTIGTIDNPHYWDYIWVEICLRLFDVLLVYLNILNTTSRFLPMQNYPRHYQNCTTVSSMYQLCNHLLINWWNKINKGNKRLTLQRSHCSASRQQCYFNWIQRQKALNDGCFAGLVVDAKVIDFSKKQFNGSIWALF